MKLTIISAMLMLSPAFLLGQTVSSLRAVTDRDEDTIRQLNAAEVTALLANDVTAMDRLWAKTFVVTNPLNQFVTRDDVIALVRNGVLAFTSYERNVEYIRVYGATAIVAGSETVVWSGKMPLAGKVSHLRFTGVWMKGASGWQQVARHANILPAP
jgi:hypothetical protein